MSWRDRPYSGDDTQAEIRLGFPRPTTTVAWLVAVNVVIFILHQIILRAGGWPRDEIILRFGLSFDGLRDLRFWQPLTYLFVHGGMFHILFNMLMLYFLGIEFERTFGRQRFLKFYFICGVCGGLAYLGLSIVRPEFRGQPLVGASGAVYGILVAAMIFFPSMRILFYFFPVPVRVFGLILMGMWFVGLISPQGFGNPGGEICHAAGALTGVLTFYAWGMMPRIRIGSGRLGARWQEGAWARRQKRLADEQAEVDRVLEKIHLEGLASLTRREKKILAEATRRQREREAPFGRLDRL
ncbi:MAG: rhomboid family intramembrane serine protease [Phycisphaerae bacterium]